MSGPRRKPTQTAISISLSKELLARIDERAGRLGLTRSQYIAQLTRADVQEGGHLTLRELPQPRGSRAVSSFPARKKRTVSGTTAVPIAGNMMAALSSVSAASVPASAGSRLAAASSPPPKIHKPAKSKIRRTAPKPEASSHR